MEAWGLNLGRRSRSNENRPPVASAGPDGSGECTDDGAAPVVLDGSASTDPDSTSGTNDDIVSYEWFENFNLPSQVSIGTGETLSARLALGTHVITLRVMDRHGLSSTDEVMMSVIDTTPPIFSLSVSPSILSPPNHMMIPVQVAWQVSDVCDPSPRAALLSAASSEPDDMPGYGDGHTTLDIQDTSIATPDSMVLLRAERSARGSGRLYILTYAATDASGNTTTVQGLVTVPQNRSPNRGTGPAKQRPARANEPRPSSGGNDHRP